MRALRCGIALLCLAAASSCGGSELEGRASTLHTVIKKAWDNGAYRCAPHELAMAESHTAFAEQEMDEGDYYRARQEMDIAEVNAQQAIEKSPKEKCNPEVAVLDQPKDVVVKRV